MNKDSAIIVSSFWFFFQFLVYLSRLFIFKIPPMRIVYTTLSTLFKQKQVYWVKDHISHYIWIDKNTCISSYCTRQKKLLIAELFPILGNRPANADHVYDFLQYTEGFPHPNSTMTDSTGGTLPTPSPRPIAETLQG